MIVNRLGGTPKARRLRAANGFPSKKVVDRVVEIGDEFRILGILEIIYRPSIQQFVISIDKKRPWGLTNQPRTSNPKISIMQDGKLQGAVSDRLA